LVIVRRKLSGVTGKALEAFAVAAKRAAGLRGEVSILVTTSEEIQQLNRDFRRKNKPTDVLSFPSDADGLAGDIAVSGDIAKENAQALRHSALTEVKVLILHGMLHLAGHDHEADTGEMAALESRLRTKFGLPQGLIERAHSSEAASPRKQAVRSGR
jgi:probable rRNA maturation factor